MSCHTIAINETTNVIVLHTQSSIKLTGPNFPAWKVQFNALLIGYDLLSFVDGTKLCSAKTHGDYEYWTRQDQLILHAILSSMDQNVVTMLGSAKNSKQAWDILNKTFASKTRTRIMQLKERLTRYNKGSKSVTEYLHGIKALSDELAVINSPLDDIDLVIHSLNGLGPEYKEISAALRARENPIGFEELHDLLQDYETHLTRDDVTPPVTSAHAAYKGKPNFSKRGYPPNKSNYSSNNNQSPQSSKAVTCQYCDKPNHTAKVCYKLHGYPSGYPNRRPAAHHARYAPSHIDPNWILDSGATHHVTNDLDQLHLTNPYRGNDHITVGDGNSLPIAHTGKLVLPTKNQNLYLPQVLHVPNISKNLLSVSTLCQTNPISIEFFSDCFLVKDLKTKEPLLKGMHSHGLYHLPHSINHPTALITTSSSHPPWHHILGHPSERIMRHLISLHQIKSSNSSACISCGCSKSHKLPFTSSSIISNRPLELIYSDVWAPAPIRSLDGYLYYLIFVDHFSKYIWLYPMKNKSDVSVIFPQFKAIVEKFFNLPIITLYSDNGGEYVKLKQFLSTNGISHYTTPPHTPELNATAERRHRHIVETARALLHHAKLPPIFWSFAFQTAAYLINRLPIPNFDMKTPHQIIYHKNHLVHHLHAFGCLCFPWLRPYTINKLQPRSNPCIFIGYSPSQYAYQCLDPITHKIYTSRHVKFYDNIYPFQSIIKPISTIIPTFSTIPLEPHTILPLHSQPPPNPTPPLNPQDIPRLNPLPTVSNNSVHEAPLGSHTSSGNNHSSSTSLSIPTNQNVAATTSHRMQTRSKNNIFKPKQSFHVSHHPLPENLEPSNIRQALQHLHWRQAISEEFDALIRNGTWTLVPPPSGHNIVECKWLFRIKRNPDGTISRYKARLVAKGYTQCPGIDFKETFAPVIRPQTIKLILTIALGYQWSMHQLDVNNAFLQGILEEDVYMAQPPGLKDAQQPHHVCKLHKAIYGLRQAPRAWYDALKTFIIANGFQMSKNDPSLFIYHKGTTIAYFLVYVDDLLLTGNETKFITHFITSLSQRFSLKNMGTPHYFLGVELIHRGAEMFLS